MSSGQSRSGPVGKGAQRRRAPAAETHARDTSALSGAPAMDHQLLELQRSVGNAVVARLIAQRQGGVGGAAIAPKVSGSPFPQRTKQFFSNGRVIGAVASATGASLVIGTSDKGGLGFPAGTQEVTFDKPGVTSSDKKGAIRFFVDMAWEFQNSDPESSVGAPVIPLHKVSNPLGATSQGSAAVKVDVPYVINTGVDKDAGKDKDTQTTESKSELKFLKERFVQQESNGVGAQLVMPVPVGADPTQDGGTVTLSPGLTFQEQIAFQSGAQSTLGIPKVPIVGSLQPDLSVTKGEQVQSQESKTQSYAESYAASVKLVPPPAAATETFKHTVFFNVDSDQVLEGEEDPELSTWCTNDDATVTQTPRGDKVLPASVLAAIAQGKATVILTGKASVTGPKGKKGSYNRKLSHRRAENVQKILSDLLGSTVKFRSFAIGKYKAKEKVKEAKEERVVEIEVTGEAAPAAAGAGA